MHEFIFMQPRYPVRATNLENALSVIMSFSFILADRSLKSPVSAVLFHGLLRITCTYYSHTNMALCAQCNSQTLNFNWRTLYENIMF